MKIRSTAEVRKNFQEVMDHVHYTKAPIIISKNRKPWVMVQPLPDDDEMLKKIIKDNEKTAK
jgi:prevent-host-death family protein